MIIVLFHIRCTVKYKYKIEIYILTDKKEIVYWK